MELFFEDYSLRCQPQKGIVVAIKSNRHNDYISAFSCAVNIFRWTDDAEIEAHMYIYAADTSGA